MFARFILALSAAVVLAAGAHAQGGKTFPQSKPFVPTKPKPIFFPPTHKVPVYQPPVYYPPVYRVPVYYPPHFPHFPKNPWWYGW